MEFGKQYSEKRWKLRSERQRLDDEETEKRRSSESYKKVRELVRTHKDEIHKFMLDRLPRLFTLYVVPDCPRTELGDLHDTSIIDLLSELTLAEQQELTTNDYGDILEEVMPLNSEGKPLLKIERMRFTQECPIMLSFEWCED